MHFPFITAHSGCDGTPDNTMEYVFFAIESGADVLEIDVHKRSDGILVIAHDHDPSLSYEHCPTVSEVFDAVSHHPSIAVNCDLKEAGLEIPTYLLARHYQQLAGRFIYTGTVSIKLLQEYPEISDYVEIYLNIEEHIDNFYENLKSISDFDTIAAHRVAELCATCGIKTVNVNHEVCTAAFVKTLADYKIGVSAWTVNDAETIKKFAALSVHNITTRNVSIALASLSR